MTDHDLLLRIDERTNAIMLSFVSQKEFKPIKAIVYGLTSAILGTVFIAFLGLILK